MILKRDPKPGSRHRGFTIIEVVIVVLVLAVLAGVVIPRLGGVGRRTERLSVDRVSDLLAAFGYRDSLASGSSAIEYDATNHSLTLLILRRNPEQPEQPEIWMRDILAPVTNLPATVELSAFEDGERLPNGDWSLLTNMDGTRPKIEMELLGENVHATVMLDPWAQTPTVVDENTQSDSKLTNAIDLDAVGQDKDPW
jgi:prepilin-type N-terminal cleavage/methylation domain-containing protein